VKTLFQGSTSYNTLIDFLRWCYGCHSIMELDSAFNVQMKKLIVKEMVGCVEV
jgi:hypothetical protein